MQTMQFPPAHASENQVPVIDLTDKPFEPLGYYGIINIWDRCKRCAVLLMSQETASSSETAQFCLNLWNDVCLLE